MNSQQNKIELVTRPESIQPDSASPTHGFNRITVFSRAVYFVLCSALCLLMSHLCDAHYENSVKLYQTTFPSRRHLELARDGTYTFILFFPIIFVLGLLPQVNTFLMYVFEQIDIHVFGGNATSSLSSSCYCLCRRSGHQLIFFSFLFVKKSLFGLEGKSKTPHQENAFLFCSSQQLPRLCMGPWKGFLS